MQPVPEISISHPGIVVDAMAYRAPLLGFFGTPRWEVRWRLVEDPQQRCTSLLPLGASGGHVELAGLTFSYKASWQDQNEDQDLARSPELSEGQDSPVEQRAADPDGGDAFVTPTSVLRLTEFSRR